MLFLVVAVLESRVAFSFFFYFGFAFFLQFGNFMQKEMTPLRSIDDDVTILK